MTASKPTRAEETRKRRRKPGNVAYTGIKLSVDDSALDPNLKYRFVRDEGNRVGQLYAQDYDRVSDLVKDDSNGLGSVPSAFGGYDDTGKPYNMVLMAKPMDLHETDQKEKQRPLDEMEEAIRRGAESQKTIEPALRGSTYTPGGTNTLERAS